MKKCTLSSIFLLIATLLLSQDLKISIAPTISNVHFYNYFAGVTNGLSHLGISSSIDYLFATNKRVEFGLGLGFQNNQVYLFTPSTGYNEYSSATEGVNIISINLISLYNLKRDFYITLVPSLDLQIKPDDLQNINNQTGLGLSLGVGTNIKLNESLELSIEPRLWLRNLIPNAAETIPYKLITTGLNLGLVFGQFRN